MSERKQVSNWTQWLMVGLILLSAALVWHDLGTREVLGRDENLTITQLDQPDIIASTKAAFLKATGQPSNMQPLFFPISHLFWPLVERSVFMLRFLPTIYALLAIVFVFKLGEALFGPLTGLLGALFTALLPLTIRYSQIARPYTLLALLSLASAYFLIQATRSNQPRHWAGFVLAATLNFYAHYNSLFVLAAEGLFVGVIWLITLVAVLRKQQSPRRLLGPVLGFLMVGVLCLPGLIRLGQLPWVGTRGKVQVELTFTFFHRFLHKIGLTTAWLRTIVLAFMGLGLVATLYRRRWRTALFVVLWMAVPFAILAVLKSPRPFAERYVIFVPPVALLLAGEGMVAVGQALGDLRWPWDARLVRWSIPLVLTGVLALLLVAPIRSYYDANRFENRLDLTLEVVERHVQPGDLIIVSPRFFLRPLDTGGAEVLYLTEHLSAEEFDQLVSSHPRTFVLYTSYLPPAELQEPMDPWIQARLDEFARVPIKAITALAYYNHTPAGEKADLEERIALLEDLAAVSADRQEAWLRHETLAQAYEALGHLYGSQGQTALAEEYQIKAEEARAAAPRPW